MQPQTDWIALWRDLVEKIPWHGRKPATAGDDVAFWREKARIMDSHIKHRWAHGSDSSRDLIAAQVKGASSFLDIGAGTGAWACLIAPHVDRVTAVEPSPALVEVMRENVAAAGLHNVKVIQSAWPGLSVEPHDFTLCSHAMYGQADLPALVRSMNAVTRRTCFMIIRMTTVDGIMGRAAQRVLGHPYDCPTGAVAYNALLQMGLFPSLLMESSGYWDPWSSASPQEAVAEVKDKLGLGEGPGEHDAFLNDMVRDSLTLQGDRYIWPRAIRSALIYWSVNV